MTVDEVSGILENWTVIKNRDCSDSCSDADKEIATIKLAMMQLEVQRKEGMI
jgi:hypothetical protein